MEVIMLFIWIPKEKAKYVFSHLSIEHLYSLSWKYLVFFFLIDIITQVKNVLQFWFCIQMALPLS